MRKIRGVSPIISVLLLIVIAVAAAVVTYGFVMGFIGGTTTTTTTTTATISIEGVNCSANKISVYVRNIGSISVNVDTAYIYFANGTLYVTSKLSQPQTIAPGEVKKIDFEIPEELKSGERYYVKISTEEGVMAPSYIFEV